MIKTIKEFSEKINPEIKSKKRVAMFFHRKPDYDSIGSCIGMENYILEQNPNIEIVIMSTDEPSKTVLNIINEKVKTPVLIKDPSEFNFNIDNDLVILIDFYDISRATKNKEFRLPKELTVFVLDHHVADEVVHENSYIETKNQSSCSIIYELLKLENIEIKKNNFMFLLLGILGDSGFFRHRDLKFSETLDIFKEFVTKYGIDSYYEIIEDLEKNRSIQEFNLQKLYMKNMVFENTYAYTYVTTEEREKEGIKSLFSETTNGATLIKNLENTDFAFAITQDLLLQNKFNITFRTCSGSGFVVRDIATILGGGGHIYASGAQIEANNIQEAIERVKSAIHEFNELRASNLSS